MKFLISHVAITKKAGRVPAFFMIANYKTLLIKYTFWGKTSCFAMQRQIRLCCLYPLINLGQITNLKNISV